MKNYIEVRFSGLKEGQSDILIALLSETGYEGFEEGDGTLQAFIAEPAFDPDQLQQTCSALSVTHEISTIPDQNWNALWESNFEPVSVDDFVSVRAAFHEPVKGVEHEILITPKMSFGTGHHATTWLMMKAMQPVSFTGKTVFDFGTGTGILAILAEKLGAESVLAIDNDQWSYENSVENGANNQCTKIQWALADAPPATGAFDIILANINRHIILEFLPALRRLLKTGGLLLLSGLLIGDEAIVKAAVLSNGLKFIEMKEKRGWICLHCGG